MTGTPISESEQDRTNKRRKARTGVRHSRFKPVRELLAGQLAGARGADTEAADSRALLESLRRCLSPSLLAHCQQASYADTTLTLTMDSPAWATRLRFNVEQLLAHPLNGEKIERVRIRVRPSIRQATTTTSGMPRATRLSAAAGRHLLAAAESTADPDLRALWERLAAHAKTPLDDA